MSTATYLLGGNEMKTFYKMVVLGYRNHHNIFIAGNNGSKRRRNCPKNFYGTKQEATTPQDKIKNNVTSIVKELHGVSIKEIKINENLGTDNPDDYIALVHLSFDVKTAQNI